MKYYCHLLLFVYFDLKPKLLRYLAEKKNQDLYTQDSSKNVMSTAQLLLK